MIETDMFNCEIPSNNQHKQIFKICQQSSKAANGHQLEKALPTTLSWKQVDKLEDNSCLNRPT